MTPPKTPEQLAEERAKRCIQERGVPHWHDLRDMYLEGFRAGQEQMNKACAKAVYAQILDDTEMHCPMCALERVNNDIIALLKPGARPKRTGKKKVRE